MMCWKCERNKVLNIYTLKKNGAGPSYITEEVCDEVFKMADECCHATIFSLYTPPIRPHPEKFQGRIFAKENFLKLFNFFL